MGVGLFADAVDALLDDNARFIAFAAALLGAHLVLGVTAVAQRRIPRLMVGLNLAVAATILLYKASEYLAYPALIEEARDDLAGNPDVKLVAVRSDRRRRRRLRLGRPARRRLRCRRRRSSSMRSPPRRSSSLC